MKYYRFPENRMVKLCFFLVLLALQLVARATMFTSTFLGFNLAQAGMIAIIGLVGLAFLGVNRRNLKPILTDGRMPLFALSAALLLIPMLVKRDWQLMYFYILLCWLFAIFLTYFTTTAELGKYYVGVMTMLSVFSLLGLFVLKPMVHMGLLPGHPFDSPGGWHMFNFGLTFVCDKNIEMHDTLRAFGIFREPGLYQIFLFVAIPLNNHVVQWEKPWKLWAVNAVLFASLVTTFATGGVLALGLYIVFLFFDKGLYRQRKMQLLMVLSVVSAAVFVAVSMKQGGTWAYELVGMVEKVLDQNYSYTARTESVVENAKLFLTHPIFGAKLSEVMYSVANNTTTSPIFFAGFGVVCGMVHVLSWAALVWKKERPVLGNLILLVILFIPFNTQNVVHDLFFWMFPLMALTEKTLPLLAARRKKAE